MNVGCTTLDKGWTKGGLRIDMDVEGGSMEYEMEMDKSELENIGGGRLSSMSG